MHELAFRSPLPLVGYLIQPDLGRRGLILPQVGIPDFGDSLREALSYLRSRWDGVERGGEGEKRREGELGLGCKIEKNVN